MHILRGPQGPPRRLRGGVSLCTHYGRRYWNKRQDQSLPVPLHRYCQKFTHCLLTYCDVHVDTDHVVMDVLHLLLRVGGRLHTELLTFLLFHHAPTRTPKDVERAYGQWKKTLEDAGVFGWDFWADETEEEGFKCRDFNGQPMRAFFAAIEGIDFVPLFGDGNGPRLKARLLEFWSLYKRLNRANYEFDEAAVTQWARDVRVWALSLVNEKKYQEVKDMAIIPDLKVIATLGGAPEKQAAKKGAAKKAKKRRRAAPRNIHANPFAAEHVAERVARDDVGVITGDLFSTSVITPYIHIFVNHVPQFLSLHKNLHQFSCQKLELANKNQSAHFHRATAKRGDANEDILISTYIPFLCSVEYKRLRYRCEKCCKKFIHPGNLRNHVEDRRNRGSGKKKYTCPYA